MKHLALLCLIYSLLPQVNPDDTVAVVLGPEPARVIIMKRGDVQQQLDNLKRLTVRSEDEDRKVTAYTLALGLRNETIEEHRAHIEALGIDVEGEYYTLNRTEQPH